MEAETIEDSVYLVCHTQNAWCVAEQSEKREPHSQGVHSLKLVWPQQWTKPVTQRVNLRW